MGGEIQVISADGAFRSDSVEEFLQARAVSNVGTGYTTVAIMGPQSSGKSTLLNATFGTDFKMMDAETGRSQTTQGVWLDLSPKVVDIPTFVMDLEGSDGRERGEDDTTFERQSALFALATADILMINLFAVNVGRVQGSGAPLLKTVLQVNLKLFQTAPAKAKTVLLIVIRDRTKTPHAKIAGDMRRDLDSIWASLVKPPEYMDSPLDEFFELQYVSLPSYELEEDDFRAECTLLRRRFLPDNEATLLRSDVSKVPSSALTLHLKEVWNVIHAQKDLDLPAHKVMVAHIRCKDIAHEQLAAATSDPAWLALLEEASGSALVADFSSRAHSLVESCVYGYDTDAMYFVDAVRAEQKEELQKGLFAALQPGFASQCALMQTQLKRTFEMELAGAIADPNIRFVDVASTSASTVLGEYDGKIQSALLVPGAPWSTGTEALRADLESLVASERQKAIAKCEAHVLEEVEAAVDGPAWMVISQMPHDLWLQLRGIVKQALKQSVTTIDRELDGVGVPDTDVQALNLRVASVLSSKLVKSLRKFLKHLNSSLLNKFVASFEEENGVRRAWNSDLAADAERARKECTSALAQLLLVPQGLSVPGVPEAVFAKARDHVVEFAASFTNTPKPTTASMAHSPVVGEREVAALLTMTRWAPDVETDAVLLSPAEVRHTWQEFHTAAQGVVRRAKDLQEERRRARSRPLPIWVLPALVFFGWNELMVLLRNPVWLILSTLLLMFLYQLYHELEVDKELEKGLPAFAINCGRKLVPCSKRIVYHTVDAIKNVWLTFLTDDSQAAGNSSQDSSITADGIGSEVEMTHMRDSPVQGLQRRKNAASGDLASSPYGKM